VKLESFAIFAQLKPSGDYRRREDWPTLASNKGGIMKKVLLTVSEPTTATLLAAIAIGLGIAVHPVFFFAALVIAIAALIQSLVNAVGHLTYRHP
jgi:DNA-binding transcriptional LysR family regulator